MKVFSIFLAIILLFVSCIGISSIPTVKEQGYNEFTIIIDAGHGGEDGGAVAFDGTYEKDINLQIAIKLNEFLSLLGYNTHMVRTKDLALHNDGLDTIRARKNSDLKNRLKLMDIYKSCYYVSIHQNKYDDSNIWGAQVFYSPNNSQSKELAEILQTTIVNNLQPENHRKIKPSGTNIFILYKAIKPAVMIECGFVSNANDLYNLKDDLYQNKLAFTISQGVVNYKISEA